MGILIDRTGKISERLRKEDRVSKLIKHVKHWTRIERDILLKFKKIHLRQQAHERSILDQNILKALEYGNMYFFIKSSVKIILANGNICVRR